MVSDPYNILRFIIRFIDILDRCCSLSLSQMTRCDRCQRRDTVSVLIPPPPPSIVHRQYRPSATDGGDTENAARARDRQKRERYRREYMRKIYLFSTENHNTTSIIIISVSSATHRHTTITHTHTHSDTHHKMCTRTVKAYGALRAIHFGSLKTCTDLDRYINL